MLKVKTMQPEYVNEFSCIADQCEDTCCGGWGVQIDKKTFKKYKQLQKQSSADKALFQGKYTINKNALSPHDYGVMRLDAEGKCMFLNNEKLCEIVLKHGPDQLCNTCKSFPRTYSYYEAPNYQEVSLTTACPEATRKLIGQHQKLSFTISETEKFDTFSFLQNTDSSKISFYAFEIRYSIIRILQADLYNLNEKMAIISLLCKKLIEENNVHYVPEILNMFDAILEEKIDTHHIQTGTKFAFELLSFTSQKKISTNKKFNHIVEKCLDGVLNDYKSFKASMEHFPQYEKKIHETIPYALENYLVNYVFKNNFPMKDNNVLDSLFLLNIHFTFIKSMVVNEIDLLEKDYEIIFKQMVDIIYSTGRALEHDVYYFKAMLSNLKQEGNYSVTHALMIS